MTDISIEASKRLATTDVCDIILLLLVLCSVMVLVIGMQFAALSNKDAKIEAYEVQIDMLQDTVIDLDAIDLQ